MSKLIVTIMVVTAMVLTAGYGQTQDKSVTPTTSVAPAIPVIPDVDKKEIDRLYSKRQLAQETANRLQLEYEKAMKELSDNFNLLSGQLSQTVDRVYADAKVTKEDFNVDVANGTFVPIDKTKK